MLARNRRARPLRLVPEHRRREEEEGEHAEQEPAHPVLGAVDPGRGRARENVAKLEPDRAAAIVHEITGWSPRNAQQTTAAAARRASRALNVAIAMPMAKKSTQFGAQIVATRSHDGVGE